MSVELILKNPVIKEEFPIRRTVFVFGINDPNPLEFLNEMIKPFISNELPHIYIDDDNNNKLEKEVGNKFLLKPKVFTLFYNTLQGNRELEYFIDLQSIMKTATATATKMEQNININININDKNDYLYGLSKK